MSSSTMQSVPGRARTTLDQLGTSTTHRRLWVGMATKRPAIGLLLLSNLLVIAGLCLLLLPPIPQSPAYHHFHDTRGWSSIPNVLNVASNVPFLLLGFLGLRQVARATDETMPSPLRPAYVVLFSGVLLTGLGSAYYHWAPDSTTLVWDRLPMTLAFMGLFAAVLGERLSLGLGRHALVPLVVCGLASVAWWAAFDDLRPYGIVQFFPLLAIPILLWAFPARYTKAGGLVAALVWYVAAKQLEGADGLVFAHGQLVSGHTLKHLAAAAGVWCISHMLATRRRVSLPDHE